MSHALLISPEKLQGSRDESCGNRFVFVSRESYAVRKRQESYAKACRQFLGRLGKACSFFAQLSHKWNLFFSMKICTLVEIISYHMPLYFLDAADTLGFSFVVFRK